MKFKRYRAAVLCLLGLVLAFALAACGGSKRLRLSFETNGAPAIEAIEAEAGENIADRLPPDPVRIGYTFEGWYLEADFSGARQGLPTVMPQKSTTYYAKWQAAAPATLTLVSNDGGQLKETSLSVAVGTPLLDVLQSAAPTSVKEGLTFAGWYQNGTPVAEGATMPARGLTLTARYSAQYTLTVYTEGDDGSYTSEEQTGTAFYGERLDATAGLTPPEHYVFNASHEGYRSETASLAAHDSFRVYLSRERFSVLYVANAPAGETASGEMAPVEVRYGDPVQAAQNGYTVSGVYRFAGWALTQNGAVEYLPGESFTPTAATVLFARWEQGKRDLFGGSDRLFPSLTEEGTVTLVRDGIGERKGTYDPATGFFAFKEGSATVLDGRIAEDWFFYFTDAYEATYADLDGTDATLTLSPHGAAVYDDGTAEYTGTYAIDYDTLYFSFTSEGLSFLFSLFEPTDGSDVVFRRQDLEEAGYYYDSDAAIVLRLDGLGGLEYHYNTENYEYMLFGEPVLTVNGYYEWNEASQLFIAYTRDFSSILKQFAFTLDTAAHPVPVGQYENIGEIKGAADMDDGLRGEYADKWSSTDKVLMLDGYGRGTYGGEEGTYALITWLYSFEDEDGDVFDDYLLVRFEPKSGGAVYFRLDLAYGEFELDRTIPLSQYNNDVPHGRIDFKDEVHTLNDFFWGFLYIFENGDAEFWSEYAEMSTGEIAYVLYNELISSVSRNADGSYHFNRSVNESTSLFYENAFDFKVGADGTAQAYYPGEHEVATVTDGLTLDFTAGVATYNGERVRYGFTIGYLGLYMFPIGGGMRYFITSDSVNFTEVFLSDMYDIVYAGGEEDDYTGRLLFAGDKVYLAFLLESDLYRIIGEGTVTEADGAEHFVLTDSMNDLDPASLAPYTDFSFKRTAGSNGQAGTFVRHTVGENYRNLTSDGYGTYTFTDGAVTLTGHIVNRTGGLMFFTDDRGASHILTAEDGTVYDVTAAGAGIWYEMNDNRLISQYDYLVLNGRGTAVFYSYDVLEGELSERRGTYERTANWSASYEEYAVTEGGETYHVLVGIYLISNGSTEQRMPLYQLQIAHRIGDFDVIGGGHVSSLGYPNETAVYTDAAGQRYEGNMYLGYVNTGASDHSFINSAARASAVRFWVYDANGLPTDTEFLFDIESGKLSLRTLPYGDYALAEGEQVNTQRILTLDGHGTASLREGYTSLGSGTYAASPDGKGYLFSGTADGEQTAFVFRTEQVQGADELSYYVYRLYTAGDDKTFTSDAEWAVLRLDGYGGATLIGRYGTLMQGEYRAVGDALGYFFAAGYETLFTTAGDKFAFVDNSAYVASYYAEDFSAVIFGAARLTVGDTEYYYTVSGSTVTRYAPDGTTDTIPLPAGDSYTLGGTTYRKVTGEVTFLNNSYEGAPLTLTFRPDGAVFTVTADFSIGSAAGSGYTLSVSYQGGAVRVTLGYRSGVMDSIPETYAVVLSFKGTDNTFTVTPAGEKGTFTDSTDPANTLNIDGLRVGQFLVTDSMTATLGGVTDLAGRPISFTGKYSAAATDMNQYDYHYGYGKQLAVKEENGHVYILRFFLDTAAGQFVLISVTLESTFAPEGVGEVTVVQLIASGRDYAGEERLSVVAVMLPANEVTETVYNMTVEEGSKALLVRSTYNTTTGAYTYETFVLLLSYDGAGLVTGVSRDSSVYRYGEAEQGILYRLAFVYTLEDGNFEIVYALGFFGRDARIAATFEKNADGTWTITTQTAVYTARVTQSGNGFSLTVTQR